MFATVVIGLLLIAAVASFVIARQHKRRSIHGSPNSRIAGIVGAVLIALSLMILGFSTIYTQDPGEAVVLRSFSGQIVGTDTSSGIGFKAPWVSTRPFDIRNQRIEMFNNESGVGPDGAAISAGLQGGANVQFSIVVRYSIQPNKVEGIYREYQSEGNLLDREMRPGVRDEARNAAAEYEPFTIKERRVALSLRIEELLAERWKDIGIIVDGVDIGEIRLDNATEEAITNVNVSRQQVETARNTLEASRIVAETVKVEAQAQADADQIIRCGATTETVTETIAGQEVTTARVIPKEGDECEERLNQQVLMAKWLDVLETLGVSGNTTIVVPNDPNGGLNLQPRIDLPVNSGTED